MDLECTEKAIATELLVFVTDADPTIDVAIVQIYETTYPIHCIFHISKNLPNNIKSKLSDQYEKFVQDFFYAEIVYVKSFFTKDGQVLLKNILA
jgi:hypothetical protein